MLISLSHRDIRSPFSRPKRYVKSIECDRCIVPVKRTVWVKVCFSFNDAWSCSNLPCNSDVRHIHSFTFISSTVSFFRPSVTTMADGNPDESIPMNSDEIPRLVRSSWQIYNRTARNRVAPREQRLCFEYRCDESLCWCLSERLAPLQHFWTQYLICIDRIRPIYCGTKQFSPTFNFKILPNLLLRTILNGQRSILSQI